MPDHIDFDQLSPENKAAVAQEAAQIGNAPVAIMELGVTSTLGLLGALQLALRHPGFRTTRTHGLVTQIAEKLHESLKPYPAIAAVAEAGWNQEFDYEPENQPKEPGGSEG